jgi:hypothetical protein
MKYIVSINELNSLELKREIRNFCEDHLVELLDQDYKLNVDYWTSRKHGTNLISMLRGNDLLGVTLTKERGFNWDDICDYFIPAFEILSRKYNIVKVNVEKYGWTKDGPGSTTKSYTKNLLNVVKSDLGNIKGITFFIKE